MHSLGHEGLPYLCARGGGEEECRRDAVKKKSVCRTQEREVVGKKARKKEKEV